MKKEKGKSNMKKKLKTITLGYADNPTVSLCPGHVTAKQFTRAHKAEGWSGFDAIDEADLTREFWVKQKRGWKRSVEGGKDSRGRKAQAVTVMHW